MRGCRMLISRGKSGKNGKAVKSTDKSKIRRFFCRAHLFSVTPLAEIRIYIYGTLPKTNIQNLNREG